MMLGLGGNPGLGVGMGVNVGGNPMAQQGMEEEGGWGLTLMYYIYLLPLVTTTFTFFVP